MGIPCVVYSDIHPLVGDTVTTDVDGSDHNIDFVKKELGWYYVEAGDFVDRPDGARQAKFTGEAVHPITKLPIDPIEKSVLDIANSLLKLRIW